MTTLRASIVTGIAIGFAPIGAAQAQGAQYHFEYGVKIVCGRPGDNGPLAMGSYWTAVNIRNPGLSQPYTRKVVIALPGAEGPATPAKSGGIHGGRAVEMDCAQIRAQLTENHIEQPNLLKGFLVLQSVTPLDVVAVYSAGPGNQVSSLHTERVPPRQF